MDGTLWHDFELTVHCILAVCLAILFIVFSLHKCQVLVILTDVVVSVFWQKGKVPRWNHISEYGLGPKFS